MTTETDDTDARREAALRILRDRARESRRERRQYIDALRPPHWGDAARRRELIEALRPPHWGDDT